MNFESWVVFNIANRHLPAGRMQRIYSQTLRSVQRWAANPRHCSETARNPIDRIRMLLDEINLAGYGDYARAAIDYMAEPWGGRVIDMDIAISDKGCVDGEIADTTVAIGNLSNIIREALEDDELTTSERILIKGAARKLIREVEQLHQGSHGTGSMQAVQSAQSESREDVSRAV